MRLFKMIIQKVPAESMTVTTCPVSGEEIIARNSSWFPKGWKEYVDEMAALDFGWALRAIEENYKFFWPTHNKPYLTRETAEAKKAIVERWGGEAIVLEAEVGEFIPVAEADAKRQVAKLAEQKAKLQAEIAKIEANINEATRGSRHYADDFDEIELG